jgi:hypothetical protein
MPPIVIPEPKKRSILRSKRVTAALAAMGAVGGAVYVLYRTLWGIDLAPLDAAATRLTALDPKLATSLLGTMSSLKSPAIWVAIAGLGWAAVSQGHAFYVAVRDDADANNRSDPYHLRAPLLVLDEVIRQKRGLPKDGKKFRATLLKITENEYIQCVDYVGWNERGSKDRLRRPAGRRWPRHCGLVGKVLRNGSRDALIFKMPDHIATIEQYWQQLVDELRYDIEEAQQLAPGRLSSAAIPIVDKDAPGGRVIGMVYCDSTDREFFDDRETLELCVLTAIAITNHIRIAA